MSKSKIKTSSNDFSSSHTEAKSINVDESWDVKFHGTNNLLPHIVLVPHI